MSVSCKKGFSSFTSPTKANCIASRDNSLNKESSFNFQPGTTTTTKAL